MVVDQSNCEPCGIGTTVFCPALGSALLNYQIAPPSSADAGADQTLCGNTANVTGNTPAIGTGVWAVLAGNGTITSPSSPTTAINNMTPGTNVFTWTVDNGGCVNVDSVELHSDDTPPVVMNCPPDVVVNNSPNMCNGIASWAEPTATDNCSVSSVLGSHSPGNTFPVGTTAVSYTATDDNGNTTVCEFDVTVNAVSYTHLRAHET